MQDNRLELDPARLCLNADAIDILAFTAQAEAQGRVREAFPASKAELGADLFTSLYRLHPRLRESPPAPARARLLKAMMETSAYHKLHSNTALDDLLSAAGTLALQHYLEHEAPEPVRRALQAEERAQALQAQADALAEIAAETGQGAGLQAQLQALRDGVAQAQAAAEEALGRIPEQQLRQGLGRVLSAASEQVENAQALAAAWGHEPGVLQQLLFDPELASSLRTAKLRRILELAGRMNELIAGERAKRPLPAPDEVEVELGNDLLNLVPAELALLADPETEDLFYRRYLERSLLQFKRTEKPKLGKGPFIVCIDESGSMQGIKEEWAKALALALMMQAQREGRKFGVVCFGSQHELRQIYDPKPAELVPFLNQFYGGGTDFERPLAEAARMLEAAAPDADVVFITDGIAAVSPAFLQEWRARQERLSFRVLSIQIGSESLDGLRPFSDRVFRLVAERGTEGLEAVVQELD